METDRFTYRPEDMTVRRMEIERTPDERFDGLSENRTVFIRRMCRPDFMQNSRHDVDVGPFVEF